LLPKNTKNSVFVTHIVTQKPPHNQCGLLHSNASNLTCYQCLARSKKSKKKCTSRVIPIFISEFCYPSPPFCLLRQGIISPLRLDDKPIVDKFPELIPEAFRDQIPQIIENAGIRRKLSKKHKDLQQPKTESFEDFYRRIYPEGIKKWYG